ncbi:MAG: ribosomal L7Ae/L30e/S12e/Gadd45 family protein [Candidatus Altiarchaeota archaeon]|nr:ribosomal L7Ae/L30e/S12e/Gadd45 family protein [Candidatus Altiarchaeota archaeon]
MTDIREKIVKAVSEGRADTGSQEIINSLLTGGLQHVLLSSTCPKKEKDSILYYCALSNTPVDVIPESSVELGSICGKPYQISAAAIK